MLNRNTDNLLRAAQHLCRSTLHTGASLILLTASIYLASAVRKNAQEDFDNSDPAFYGVVGLEAFLALSAGIGGINQFFQAKEHVIHATTAFFGFFGYRNNAGAAGPLLNNIQVEVLANHP